MTALVVAVVEFGDHDHHQSQANGNPDGKPRKFVRITEGGVIRLEQVVGQDRYQHQNQAVSDPFFRDGNVT